MTLETRIERGFGFPDDSIVAEAYEKGIDSFSEILLCKIGIYAALSDNEDYFDKKAPAILVKLHKNHDRASPVMLLKWLIQIKRKRDPNGNLLKQIEDWAKEHFDDLFYWRTMLVLHSLSKDNIEVIGMYIKHLEIFWKDDMAWARLGALYNTEKSYEMAAFAYEEAVALVPSVAAYYREAARNRLLVKDEGKRQAYVEIARKQLAKAVMLDERDAEAWRLLIENTTDEGKKRKYEAYRKQVLQ